MAEEFLRQRNSQTVAQMLLAALSQIYSGKKQNMEQRDVESMQGDEEVSLNPAMDKAAEDKTFCTY